MKGLVAGAATAVMLAIAPAAIAAVPPAAKPDPVTNGVHVIGDSIAYYAAHEPGVLDDAPDWWTRDTYPGRRINALRNPLVPHSSDRAVAAFHMFTLTRKTRVSTVVIALGTNSTTRTLTLEQAARFYRTGIRTLRAQPIWKPGPRRIVLVLPYTAARLEGDPVYIRQWPSKTAMNASAMRLVARELRDVCVMPWRGAIAQHRDWLVDGVHPNRDGLLLWRDLLFDSIRSCSA